VNSSGNSDSSENELLEDIQKEPQKTIEILQKLKKQRSHPYHILKEGFERKKYINDRHIQKISDVQKFHSEVGQFEADVKDISSSRNINDREVAEKIAYEEDTAVKDLKKAAEAVIGAEELKERCLEKREKYRRNNQSKESIIMADTYLILEAALRDLSHYFWEGYSEIRVMANRLAKEENYDVFKKEINRIKEGSEIQGAIEVIEENYGGPGALENDRYAGLEKKAREIIQN